MTNIDVLSVLTNASLDLVVESSVCLYSCTRWIAFTKSTGIYIWNIIIIITIITSQY